ncbi:MAG: sulfatase-like hydrolase/transferase, partial [Bryobacteraceae bacterium]
APHAPYLVAEKYSKPYLDRGLSPTMAAFYGMITNLDENVALLRSRLRELGLEENTIFIYMTDNGSAAGFGPRVESERWKGFNAGMRGVKGAPYEGGHRVPFFIRWPGGGLGKPRDIPRLAAHIDVLPTLIDLVGLAAPKAAHFDGVSLAPLLTGKGSFPPDRTHFVQHNQIVVDGKYQMEQPQLWRNAAVLTERWRLVNGRELFDIQRDPGQTTDIAARHPQEVAKLRMSYERWHADVSRNWSDPPRIVIGSDKENPAELTCFDWHAERLPANQEAVRQDPEANGYWHLEVERAGKYEITLRHRPAVAGFPIAAAAARLKIGASDQTSQVKPGATSVTFRVDLQAGPARLKTWLTEASGKSRGAFYVQARRI